jgi:hypothetical protein
MMTSNAGADRIAVERRRQIAEEGFDPAHDVAYRAGTLVSAAVVYALHALVGLRGGSGPFGLEEFSRAKASFWPWHNKWWKPKSPIRNLERAGALIAAEIDRIINAEGGVQDPAEPLGGKRSEELWAAADSSEKHPAGTGDLIERLVEAIHTLSPANARAIINRAAERSSLVPTAAGQFASRVGKNS